MGDSNGALPQADRATRASTEPASSLGHSAGIPSAAGMSTGKFKGPTKFYDGRNGWARQDFESLENPRFGYAWQRENRKDRGRTWFMVDGREVADFDEADQLLALPPSPDNPAELCRVELEEMFASPRLGGASRARNEAECNAAAGPFASVRATMQRVGGAWHSGLNRYSDQQREAAQPFPGGLYNAKTAAYEAFRSMYLWAGDREKDTGLQCALGKKCRKCPILKAVEESCIAARDAEKFGRPDIETEDIDFAKTWTCIGHILQEAPNGFFDGAFFSTKADREDRSGW